VFSISIFHFFPSGTHEFYVVTAIQELKANFMNEKLSFGLGPDAQRKLSPRKKSLGQKL